MPRLSKENVFTRHHSRAERTERGRDRDRSRERLRSRDHNRLSPTDGRIRGQPVPHEPRPKITRRRSRTRSRSPLQVQPPRRNNYEIPDSEIESVFQSDRFLRQLEIFQKRQFEKEQQEADRKAREKRNYNKWKEQQHQRPLLSVSQDSLSAYAKRIICFEGTDSGLKTW